MPTYTCSSTIYGIGIHFVITYAYNSTNAAPEPSDSVDQKTDNIIIILKVQLSGTVITKIIQSSAAYVPYIACQ